MIRKVLYGWRVGAAWCLGRNPPDSPSNPYTAFPTKRDAELAAEVKRAKVIWCESTVQS